MISQGVMDAISEIHRLDNKMNPPKKPEEHEMTAAKKELMPDGILTVLSDEITIGREIYKKGQYEFRNDGSPSNPITYSVRAEPPCDDAILDAYKPEFREQMAKLYGIKSPAPISVEALEGMKREGILHEKRLRCSNPVAFIEGWDAFADAIIEKLRGE